MYNNKIKTFTVSPGQGKKLFGVPEIYNAHNYKSEYHFYTFTDEHGDEYLFKDCVPDKLIGEVVHSKLGQALDIPVARNAAAILENKGKQFHGIISKSFLKDAEQFRPANLYFERLRHVPYFEVYFNYFQDVDLRKLVKKLGKFFPNDIEQIGQGLGENFLIHKIANTVDVSDLHNIGFLLSDDAVRVAPAHDFSPVKIYGTNAAKPTLIHKENIGYIRNNYKELATKVLDNIVTIRNSQDFHDICDVTPYAPLMPKDYNIQNLTIYSERIHRSLGKSLDAVTNSFN